MRATTTAPLAVSPSQQQSAKRSNTPASLLEAAHRLAALHPADGAAWHMAAERYFTEYQAARGRAPHGMLCPSLDGVLPSSRVAVTPVLETANDVDVNAPGWMDSGWKGDWEAAEEVSEEFGKAKCPPPLLQSKS